MDAQVLTEESPPLPKLEAPEPSRRAQSDTHVPVPLGELFEVAVHYERSGKMAEADRLLKHILAVAPDQPDTLHLAGIVAFRLGRQQEAVEKIEHAIAKGVDIALYLRNICEVYRHLNRLDDAIAAAQRAVHLLPNDPLSLHNLAVIHYERGEVEESRIAAERALQMGPDLAGPHFARAEALLIQGRWQEGWDEYEWRFRLPDGAQMMPTTDKPQWDGQPFDDCTLMLIGDQGFGDIIQFSRYIPWAMARCPHAMIACPPDIAPVVGQFLPAEKIITRTADWPPFKAYIALSGLPRLHGTTLDNIPGPHPYLRALPARVAKWHARLRQVVPPTHKRIGIVWAGRPTHNNDRRRSARLADFAPLSALPRVSLISLQKGPSTDQAGSYFGRAPLINIGAEIRDYDDTMALIDSLDLVVTVDTSVGHLAAALGKPVWILVATAPDWRWLTERSDSPWYPSVRLFRQTVSRQWSDVFRAVAAALA